MPVVRMPNGDQVKFPDTMSSEEIRAKIESKFGTPDTWASQASTKKEVPPIVSMVTGAAQSIPFGDEAAAALGATIATPINAITSDAPLSVDQLKKNYNTAYQELNALTELSKQNPISYYGAQFAPMVAGGIAAGNVLTSLAGKENVAGKLADAALRFAKDNPALGSGAVGGVQGAVYGAGSGGETGDNRLENMGVGAAGGAILGSLAPSVVSGIGSVGKGLADRAKLLFKKPQITQPIPPTQKLGPYALNNQFSQPVAAVSDSVAKKADKKIVDAIKKDFPDNWEGVLNSYKNGNITLAEISGPNLKQLQIGAALFPSGKGVASTFFEQRVAKSGENSFKSLKKNVSPTQNFIETLDETVKAGQEKAAPLYQKAFKQNDSVYSKKLDNILNRPAAKQALQDAVVNMRNEGKLVATPDKYLTELAKDAGAIESGQLGSGLKLETLHNVKISLDKRINAIQTSLNPTSADKVQLNGFKSTRDALVSEIDNLDKTGLYAKARSKAGDYLRIKAAMEEGKNFATIHPDELSKYYSKLPEIEKKAYKSGVVFNLRNKAVAGEKVNNPYTSVFQKNSSRLAKILNPEEYKNLKSDFMAEDAIFKMRYEVLGGSQTAERQVAKQNFIDEDALSNIVSAVRTPKEAAFSAIVDSVKRFNSGLSDELAGRVAKILYEQNPREKLKFLEKINSDKIVSPVHKQQMLQTYYAIDDSIRNRVSQSATGGAIAEPLVVTVRPSDKEKQ